MPAAAAAAASSGVSTNSLVICRLPFCARRSATVMRLCFFMRFPLVAHDGARVDCIAVAGEAG